MEPETKSTKPKPFIFVLMPFDPSFDDIYKFGIKGAAEEAGAYAERVDEQIFSEGILERVFNQINKADVVVADMTGRNPNVFYEVGYAHALDKIVLLLTQNVDDIPFDLQHHQHTVYEGRIDKLREELTKRLQWAIKESSNRSLTIQDEFEVRVNDVSVRLAQKESPLVLKFRPGSIEELSVTVRNVTPQVSPAISYVYLLVPDNSPFSWFHIAPEGVRVPIPLMKMPELPASDFTKGYRLRIQIPSLPPGAFEVFKMGIRAVAKLEVEDGESEVILRFHTSHRALDYQFRVLFSRSGEL